MINKAAKIILSVCAGLVILVLIFSKAGILKAGIFNKSIGPKEAGIKVLNMVNKYYIPDKSAVLSGKPVEENGLYKVTLSIRNNPEPFYLTKDGAVLIFPNGIVNIAKFEAEVAKQQQIKEKGVPKTQHPVVELFVMSLCPYGVKAEKEILPVVNDFGDKIDFKIKFIVNVRGESIDQVSSLHGIDEVKENLRQAAIMRQYPDKFSAYIDKINEKSCVISCGEIKLEDYWKKGAKELGIDTGKIEPFAYGQEGMNLLKQDEIDAKKYNVNASPTLVINGTVSKAISQGAQAIRQEICSAFTNPPAVCQKAKE